MGDEFIDIDDQQYLRSRVTAKLQLADDKTIPQAIASVDNLHSISSQSPDLVYVSFTLDTEGANKNWDYMPRNLIVANHGTAIYKPIDVEHVIKEQASMASMSKDNPPVKNTICGVMTHTALCWAKTGTLLTNDEVKGLGLQDDMDRADDDKVAIRAWGAMYRFLFPKTVSDLLDAIDDGEMFVSMERWISKCDYMAWDGKKYLAYSSSDADTNGVGPRWKQHQAINGKPVLRRSLAAIYGGVANTTNPANPACRFYDPEVENAISSGMGRIAMADLQRKHDDLHAKYLSAAASEKHDIIAQHEQITRDIIACLRTSSQK